MTEPVFTRAGTTRLYWADPADPVAAFRASDPDALGATATLTRTWQDTGGCYVFLGAPAADATALAAALTTWLGFFPPTAAPRFVWLPDPDAPPTAWAATAMTGQPGPGSAWTGHGATFQLAEYQLTVSGGSTVAPAETAAGWGFSVADTATWPAAALYSPTDLFPARPGTTLLSMDAGRTGTWRLVTDSPAGSDAFARLGAEIRFFLPGADGQAETVRFPVLRQAADAGLALYAQIDPLRPLDGERTRLGLLPWSPGGDVPGALPSGHATVLGHDVTLRPLAPDAGGPPGLVFAVAPYLVGEPVNAGLYLVPSGPFAVDAGPDGGRVMCGASALEYLGVPAEGCVLTYEPGHPAYAPRDAAAGGPLTSLGTTSWVRVAPPPGTAGLTYYSQPEDAPLHTDPVGGAEADGGVRLLGYHEVPAADASRAAFPMAPFRALAPESVASALEVERGAVAPARRAALLPAGATGVGEDDAGESGGMGDSDDSADSADSSDSRDSADTGGSRDSADSGDETIAVTPQGLAVGLAADQSWNWLGIGHSGDASAALPDLRFTSVTGPFRQAMQTNDLFLVLGDPAEFHRFGSVPYLLTTADLDIIATVTADRGGVRPEVLAAVRGRLADREYATRPEFTEALTAASPDITPEETQVFLRHGGQLTPVVGGWPFRLSPDNWRDGTFLIVKLGLGRAVGELVEDIPSWAWPEAAAGPGHAADARAAIRAVIEAARREPADSPYGDFVRVVDDPRWTGILALSADVPLERLPAELQMLAAGIDPTAFAAHHVGMSLTPFRMADGQLVFQRSSMFGLIDHRNPEDQYFTENIAYAFRVLSLTVGVRNTLVTTFTSRAELLVNRLFGAPARLLPSTHGNNVVLDGALQRQQLPDGTAHDAYVFAATGENAFLLDGPVLGGVQLLSTRLVTAKPADPAAKDATVRAVFLLGGNLRFHEPEGFDPFCWGEQSASGEDGYLRFDGLGIEMSFTLGDPAGSTVFTLRDGDLSFDPAHSKARPESLVNRFPIRLDGLIATPDPRLAQGAPPAPRTPADLGYVSAGAPLEQSVLTQPWYGLDFTIDLGTLGALAGAEPLALKVLAAWSPGGGEREPGLYLGVRLPGADGLLGVSLPLQGVIKMGFRSVEFHADDPPGGPRSYTLRLRDFALRLLGLAFPPGHNDVVLFGNPDQSGPAKVGWYLAYASDTDPTRPAPQPTRAEITERRAETRSRKEG
ncbi:hypothetical protein ACH4ZX_16885 [Streptomyces sp. NPDC020490]|uniref:hypothetical protein n=1 Tax=Streptomyces sp. NPDC020490 TaxID=3365078 RepID=UPI00379BCB45